MEKQILTGAVEYTSFTTSNLERAGGNPGRALNLQPKFKGE
jgi:hypothetical protein